jgi:hypothetical protein
MQLFDHFGSSLAVLRMPTQHLQLGLYFAFILWPILAHMIISRFHSKTSAYLHLTSKLKLLPVRITFRW